MAFSTVCVKSEDIKNVWVALITVIWPFLQYEYAGVLSQKTMRMLNCTDHICMAFLQNKPSVLVSKKTSGMLIALTVFIMNKCFVKDKD